MAVEPAPVIDPARAAESNAARIIGIMTTFLAFSLPFVILRLYARIKIMKTPGWDDAFIAMTSVCTVIGLVIYGVETIYGLGRHRDTLGKDEARIRDNLAFWQAINISNMAFTFVKLSIGFCLLRLHAGVGGWFRWTLWVMLSIVAIKGVLGPLSFLLHCQPMAGHWDKELKATCYPFDLYIKFGVASTSWDLVTDVTFAVLPIPVIWRLQMKRRTRIYLIAILSLGWVAVFVGVSKAVFQFDLLKDKDSVFNATYQVLNYVEINLAIAAACAPMLKPFFGKVLGLGSEGRSKYPVVRSSNGRSAFGGRSTFGGGRGAHPSPHADLDYDLDERVNYLPNTEQGHERSITFYKHNPSGDSGSEEMILQGTGNGHENGGILKTMEFSVKQKN